MKNLLFFCISMLFIIASSEAQTAISIQEARSLNPDGSLEREGQSVELNGIAIGPNFRPGGLTFVLFDTIDNVGITVFSTTNDSGYQVEDGDALSITGELSQFNGLAEIIPSVIELNAQGNGIPDPEIVEDLNELSESKLVTFQDASLVDPDDWQSSGSFNVLVTDGVNTIELRIDSDTDISGMDPPTGTFDVTGIGGQFDPDSPFDEGYQLFPRNSMDIDPYNTGEKQYESLNLEEARETEQDGSLRRAGDCVALTGTVYGINLRPGGLQFTIINDDNTGIGVFSSSEDFGYTVNESDQVMVLGELSQFSGLAQVIPDSLIFLSGGNPLVDAREVSVLDESTESSLVTINAMHYVDESEWLGDGSSFNVDVVVASGDTLTVRIDNDNELSGMDAPPLPAFITGIGGQFDPSQPYTSGYQLFPRYAADIEPYLGVEERFIGEVSIFPNPARDIINIVTDKPGYTVSIYTPTGKHVKKALQDHTISVADLAPGTYLVRLQWEQKYHIQHIQVLD